MLLHFAQIMNTVRDEMRDTGLDAFIFTDLVELQTAFSGGLHWSEDGGRTWSEPQIPEAWQREESRDGKTWRRGAGDPVFSA